MSRETTTHPESPREAAPEAACQAAIAWVCAYTGPLGAMTLAAVTGDGLPEGGALRGVWFDGQEHDRAGLPGTARAIESGSADEPAVLSRARAWLDAYFAGADTGEPPALAAEGTPFQQEVWAQLRAIPAGEARTYGQLAEAVEARTGHRGSARAVGGAVGRNPLSVVVPCHRVVAADGALTGYAGGTDRKTWLLRHEGIDLPGLGIPQDGLPGL